MTTPACSNCGLGLTGPFCAGCGQRRRDGRLTVRRVGGDLLRHAFNLDSALLRTVRGLFRDPGGVCRAYVGGQRARFVNPLKYAVIVLALYLVVTALIGIDAGKAMGLTVEGTDGDAARMWMTRRLNVMVFLSIPLFALLLRGYYFKAGYNYAEILAFTLFVVGQAFLYSTMVVWVGVFAPKVATALRAAAHVALYTWAARRFFGRHRWLSWFKALGVQILFVLSMIPIGLGMFFWYQLLVR